MAWTLQQAVRVQCSGHQLTASLPAELATALGVTGLFLSDRGCSGRRNATHWTITSRVTSCGSTLRIGDKLTTYSNLVGPPATIASQSLSTHLRLVTKCLNFISILVLFKKVHVQLAATSKQRRNGSDDDEEDDDFVTAEGSGSEKIQSATGLTSKQITIPIQCYSQPLGNNFKHPLGDRQSDADDVDEDNVMVRFPLSLSLNSIYLIKYHNRWLDCNTRIRLKTCPAANGVHPITWRFIVTRSGPLRLPSPQLPLLMLRAKLKWSLMKPSTCARGSTEVISFQKTMILRTNYLLLFLVPRCSCLHKDRNGKMLGVQ